MHRNGPLTQVYIVRGIFDRMINKLSIFQWSHLNLGSFILSTAWHVRLDDQ